MRIWDLHRMRGLVALSHLLHLVAALSDGRSKDTTLSENRSAKEGRDRRARGLHPDAEGQGFMDTPPHFPFHEFPFSSHPSIFGIPGLRSKSRPSATPESSPPFQDAPGHSLAGQVKQRPAHPSRHPPSSHPHKPIVLKVSKLKNIYHSPGGKLPKGPPPFYAPSPDIVHRNKQRTKSSHAPGSIPQNYKNDIRHRPGHIYQPENALEEPPQEAYYSQRGKVPSGEHYDHAGEYDQPPDIPHAHAHRKPGRRPQVSNSYPAKGEHEEFPHHSGPYRNSPEGAPLGAHRKPPRKHHHYSPVEAYDESGPVESPYPRPEEYRDYDEGPPFHVSHQQHNDMPRDTPGKGYSGEDSYDFLEDDYPYGRKKRPGRHNQRPLRHPPANSYLEKEHGGRSPSPLVVVDHHHVLPPAAEADGGFSASPASNDQAEPPHTDYEFEEATGDDIYEDDDYTSVAASKTVELKKTSTRRKLENTSSPQYLREVSEAKQSAGLKRVRRSSKAEESSGSSYWQPTPFIAFDRYKKADGQMAEVSQNISFPRDSTSEEQRFFPSFPAPPYLSALNPFSSSGSGARAPLFPGPSADRRPSRFNPFKFSSLSRGPSTVAASHDRYQDSNLLGSGNFEVVRGGTYYAEDEYGGGYHHPEEEGYYGGHHAHSAPYRHSGGSGGSSGDFFANFRDFADINPHSRSYSQPTAAIAATELSSHHQPVQEADPMMATY